MPDLAPLQEVAEEFDIGQATLYRYLRNGELQRYRRNFDRRTYLDRDEVRRLMEPTPVHHPRSDH